MARSKPPKARFTAREKAMLLAMSKVPEGSRAQEQLRSLLVGFTKDLSARLPRAGG